MEAKFILLFFAVFVGICYSRELKACARLTSGSQGIKGSVKFTHLGGGRAEVKGKFSGLQPGLKYGVHIHDGGNISNNCANVGHHFEPRDEPHDSHLGDLAEITADSEGKAHFEKVLNDVELEGPRGIVGRAVGIATEDDSIHHDEQPAIGCGVINLRDNRKRPDKNNRHRHHPRQ